MLIRDTGKTRVIEGPPVTEKFLTITETDSKAVLLVTLNRPPVNAVTLDIIRESLAFFSTVEDNYPDACVVVLTGAGHVFCAGADVNDMAARTVQSHLARSAVSRVNYDAIRTCKLPVIAALNGPAVGAGTVLAACCDIIMASETASFALTEVLIGVMGGTRHMNQILPNKVTRYLALSGRKMGAEQLMALGAVHSIHAPEDLLPDALALAEEMAGHSPTGIRLMKEAINLTEEMSLNDGYRVEQLFTTLASSMPQAKEAAAAFVEKRKPDWSKT